MLVGHPIKKKDASADVHFPCSISERRARKWPYYITQHTICSQAYLKPLTRGIKTETCGRLTNQSASLNTIRVTGRLAHDIGIMGWSQLVGREVMYHQTCLDIIFTSMINGGTMTLLCRCKDIWGTVDSLQYRLISLLNIEYLLLCPARRVTKVPPPS